MMASLEADRAELILDRIRSVRALVVGDLMLDQYIIGRVDRISPEAPVPVVRVEEERWAVGGAGNVAANVGALGAGCDVVGMVGRDDGGERLLEALRAAGVTTERVVRSGDRPTTVKTRVRARQQQVVRFDREDDGDVAPELAEELVAEIRGAAREVDVVILEDYNKGLLVHPVIRETLAAAREAGIPSVVDPKRIRFFDYGGCTVFKPNAKELADALGEHLEPDDSAWLQRTRERLACDHLLLTLGDRGMALATSDGAVLRVPAVGRDVYDVSGAGDTVVSVTALALAAGADPGEAAILANHAAALEVAKAGVATVSPEEILTQIRTFQEYSDFHE